MPPDRPRAAKIKPDTFASVIRAYMTSPKFDALAKSTRTGYGYLLRRAEEPRVLGAYPVDVIRPALVQAFLDGFADRPAQQKTAQTAFKSLEKWAIVRDLLPHPITTGTEAPGSQGGHEPWTDEQVAYAQMHCRPHLARIIVLGANTGQRGSDLVRMRWSDMEDYEGRPGLKVTQKKTGMELWIPLTQELAAALSSWERRPTFIALKEDGLPWTREQLSDTWLRERTKHSSLAGLRLHGLRATAVVRLRRAGATLPQIGDMIGMSQPMVARYCRLSVQKENALAAVHHLDRTQPERTLRQRTDRGE